MFVNRRTVKIEWGDCDPAGIVFYPRYFAFFDASTHALFEAAGLPKPRMIREFDIVGTFNMIRLFGVGLTSAEALAGVPALTRHGSDTPFRDECRPLTGRMDASQPPLLAHQLVVPFSADEFHKLGDHPLVGLFPCVAHGAGSPATADVPTGGE